MSKNEYNLNLNDLRKKAEKFIHEKEKNLETDDKIGIALDEEVDKNLTLEEARQIIREINIYQVELEMQNEQLNQAYSEIKAHYFDLFNSAPVGYLTLDKDLIIKDANYTSLEIMDRNKSEILKKPFYCFIYSHDQDEFYFKRKEVMESGTKQTCELRIIVGKTLPLWVQLEMTKVFDYEFDEYNYRVVIIDITERKKAEKAIESFYQYKNQADKYESLCVLAGGLAHDLNNYLATLSVQVSYCMKNINSPEKVYEKLEGMQNVIENVSNLTNELSLFAKGEETFKKTVDINKTIEESINLALANSNVNIHLELENNLSKVNIDEGMVIRALYNILINALQAVEDKGNIWINSALEGITKEKYIKISIKDDGPGISDSYKEKIYDPFFTTKIEGSGLGLATAFSIIKEHDGYVEVDSKASKGTTFYICREYPNFCVNGIE